MNSDESKAGPLRTANMYALVAAVTLIANLLIIANPGFQSHDEWQIYDFVQKYGLPFFIRAYVRVYAGPEFGWPVRPLGFLQEGLLSHWMPSAPVVLHLFSVALLMVTALVFIRVLTGAGINQYRATAAGLLFGISPLVAFSTGWTAACFDQWYSLFAVLAAWATVGITDRGFSAVRVLGLAAASGLAILSKETALMLPAAAGALTLVIGLLRGGPPPWRKAILVGIISMVPVLIYLAIRLPAILATLRGSGGDLYYPPSVWNVPGNAVVYFAYPALFSTVEIPAIDLAHNWPFLAAACIHLLLVLGILLRFGWVAAGAYVAAYLVFLLPILTLPSADPRYLYGSAFATSLALASLLFDAAGRFRPRVVAVASVACAAVFTAHSFEIQRYLYDDGRCQHDFLLSLDLRMRETPGPIVIRPDPGARWPNGVRAIHGRDPYARVTVTDPASAEPADYRMDWACRVMPAKP